MRILIAHNFYRTHAGEDRYVVELADLLRNNGYEVGLLAFQSDEMGDIAAALYMLKQTSSPKQIRQVATDFRPDVIHLHNPFPAIGARGVKTLREVSPIVMTLHNYRLRCPNGLMFTEGQVCRRCVSGVPIHSALHGCFPRRIQGLVWGLGLGIERLMPLENHISHFVAPSSFLKNVLANLGLPRDRISVIPHFGEVNPSPAPLGDQLVFAGRIAPEKGAHLVAEAARATGIRTVLLGDGPDFEAVRATAPSHVEMTGWQSEEAVFDRLSAARLVVIPSTWYENLPLVLITALGQGRPVLAAEGTSVAQIVMEAQAGECFARGSASSLANLLVRRWDDLSTLQHWSSAATSYAQAHLRPLDHIQALDDIYKAVALD